MKIYRLLPQSCIKHDAVFGWHFRLFYTFALGSGWLTSYRSCLLTAPQTEVRFMCPLSAPWTLKTSSPLLWVSQECSASFALALSNAPKKLRPPSIELYTARSSSKKPVNQLERWANGLLFKSCLGCQWGDCHADNSRLWLGLRHTLESGKEDARQILHQNG